MVRRRLGLTLLSGALACGQAEREAPAESPRDASAAPGAVVEVAAAEVRVLRADGAAAAGVRVALVSAASEPREVRLAEVVTDAEGRASLVLPEGRAEFVRLRVEVAGVMVERAIDPRDRAPALEVRLAVRGAEVAAPGSESAALWAAQAIAAGWSAEQAGRVEAPTPAERAAICGRAQGEHEDPAIASRLRVLALHLAASQECGWSASEVLATLAAIGAEEPLWALDRALLSAPLNALAAGGEADGRRGFVDEVIARHASAVLVSELLLERLVENEDEEERRRLVRALRGPRFAGTAAVAGARAFDPDHLRPGSEIPAFSAVTLTGESLSRESLRGRPYVIDFWGTWCGGCIEEMPELHAAFAEVNGIARPPRSAAGWRKTAPPADPRVTFISVASNEEPESLAAFRREQWPLPWVNVLDPDSPSSMTAVLGVDKFPTALFVDARGVIVQKGGDLREGARKLVAP